MGRQPAADGLAHLFAVGSQQRWAAAQAAGRFQAELAPLTLASKKGPVTFERDEHPRPNTTVEGLGKLPKVFKKDGVVTAGNASGGNPNTDRTSASATRRAAQPCQLSN